MTRLGELLDELQTGFACGQEDDAGVFQFRMHNVSKSSDLVLDKRRRVPRSAHRKITDFYLRPGDILFNATNSPDAVGKSLLVPALDEPAVFSNHFLRMRPAPGLDAGYLWRWLQWQFLRGTFLGMTRQWVNQATVSREDVLALDVPVRPLPEQRRIAAILDAADAIRAKRRAQLAHLDELPQALFHEMFSPSRYPNVPAGTVMPYLRNGVSPATNGAHEATVLTLSAITQGYFDPSAAKVALFAGEPPLDKRVTTKDFLMCRGNGNSNLVGVGVASQKDRPDLVFPDTVIAGRIDDRQVVMPYLEAVWHHPAVRRQIAQGARTTNGTFKVNQQIISSVEIPLPPLPLQQSFAAKVEAIHAERARVARALEADDELFAALQHLAFRGEL